MKSKSKSKGSFFYCLGQGFAQIRRNTVFFIASAATIAACIFLSGLFIAVVMNVNNMVKQVENTVCITVFFNEGLEEDSIKAIGSDIETWSEVEHVEYTSAEEAWENYKEQYFKDYPELAEGFADDNPLANSASYDIYLNDIEDQAEVVEKLEDTEGIRQVNRSETTVGALSDIAKIVGIVSIVLIIVLLAVSIFLITNTIVTGITMHKEELQIMKYVGATDFFVKSPYVFEGIIIGIIGAIIPLVIIYFIYQSAISYFVDQLQIISSTIVLLPVWSVFQILIPAALVIGAGIGFIGSTIATGKHIKV